MGSESLSGPKNEIPMQTALRYSFIVLLFIADYFISEGYSIEGNYSISFIDLPYERPRNQIWVRPIITPIGASRIYPGPHLDTLLSPNFPIELDRDLKQTDTKYRDSIKDENVSYYKLISENECRDIFAHKKYRMSPFASRICYLYRAIIEVDDNRDKVHFVNKKSRIVNIEDVLYFAINLGLEPEVRFAVWYGVSHDVLVAEAKNIREGLSKWGDMGSPWPYLGLPKQNLQVDILADTKLFEMVDRYEGGNYVDDGVSVFSSIDIYPYPKSGLFWVSAKLSEVGKNIFQKGIENKLDFHHVIFFPGRKIVNSSGSIECFRLSTAKFTGSDFRWAEVCP